MDKIDVIAFAIFLAIILVGVGYIADKVDAIHTEIQELRKEKK
jgi:hypothetical protein